MSGYCVGLGGLETVGLRVGGLGVWWCLTLVLTIFTAARAAESGEGGVGCVARSVESSRPLFTVECLQGVLSTLDPASGGIVIITDD